MEEITYSAYMKNVPWLRKTMIAYMAKNDLSIKQLAEHIGISRALATNFLGEKITPTLKTVLKIDSFFRKLEGD